MSDMPICPECRQGKHVNCTHEVLIDDEFLPCCCDLHENGER